MSISAHETKANNKNGSVNYYFIMNQRRYKKYKFMRYLIIILGTVLLTFTSCQKEAGKGGTGVVTGKVYAKDYKNGFLVGEFYAPEERVYIMYGNSTIYNDDMRTNFDGSYRFDYLYPGTYVVFAYSKCDTCPSGVEAIKDTVVINAKGDIAEVPDLVIIK